MVVFRKDTMLKPFTNQPLLWQMTEKAPEILGKHPKGFCWMAEGASIDRHAYMLDWG